MVLDGRTPISTGSTKVGSLIGDHTKTSIGTLLNTGAYVGAMALIAATGKLLPKFIPLRLVHRGRGHQGLRQEEALRDGQDRHGPAEMPGPRPTRPCGTRSSADRSRARRGPGQGPPPTDNMLDNSPCQRGNAVCPTGARADAFRQNEAGGRAGPGSRGDTPRLGQLTRPAMLTPEQLEAFCNNARRMGALDAVVVPPAARCPRPPGSGCGANTAARNTENGMTCRPTRPLRRRPGRCSTSITRPFSCTATAPKPLREIARALELKVFLAGYYKAFAFLVGPCDRCRKCVVIGRKRGKPLQVQASRGGAAGDGGGRASTSSPPPGAAGLPIEVVTSAECPQNYYALVLVE